MLDPETTSKQFTYKPCPNTIIHGANSVLKATRRPWQIVRALSPRQQGGLVPQGELGPPGHLGDAFETLGANAQSITGTPYFALVNTCLFI